MSNKSFRDPAKLVDLGDPARAPDEPFWESLFNDLCWAIDHGYWTVEPFEITRAGRQLAQEVRASLAASEPVAEDVLTDVLRLWGVHCVISPTLSREVNNRMRAEAHGCMRELCEAHFARKTG